MKEGQPSRQTKLERPPLHLIIHLSVTVIGKWCALWLNASARLFLYTYCPCLPTFSSRFLSSILPDRSCVCGLHACLCWLVHVCARVRLFRFTAGDRSWIEMGEQKKNHLSPFHSITDGSSFSSTSLVAPPPPRSHFDRRKSQPVSSHLHPSATMKLGG